MELFANSYIFIYMLLTGLILALVWYLGVKRKEKITSLIFSEVNYKNLIPAELKTLRRISDIVFLSGIFFLFIAIAAPQWGREKVLMQANYSQAVIAVDVSTSMLAQDVKPDRLESAKLMVSMLVENMLNERLGIIAFTSQAYLQSPITTDAGALKSLTESLSTDMLPVQGTALGPAVSLSAKMLAQYPGKKAVVLVTDGEDHSPQDVEAAIKTARDNDIKVIAVGIGSSDGELIPVKGQGNAKAYKKDAEGKTVITKLDEQTLIAFAKSTGGVYIRYTTPQSVADEIAVQLAALDRTTIQNSQNIAYKNRYQMPLFIAFLLVLCSILIPLRKVK